MKRGIILLFTYLLVSTLLSVVTEGDFMKYDVPVFGQDSLLVRDSLTVKADVYIVNYDIDSIAVHYLNPSVRSIVKKYIFRYKNKVLLDAGKSKINPYAAVYVLKKSLKKSIQDSVIIEVEKIDYYALIDSVMDIDDNTHRKYNISEGFHYDGYHDFDKLIRRDGMVFVSDKVSLPLYYQTMNRFYNTSETENSMILNSRYYELEPMMVKAYMATGDYNYDFIVLDVGKDKIFGKDIQLRFDYVGFNGELYDDQLQVINEANGSIHLQLKAPLSYGEIETRYINSRQKVPEKKVLRNPITNVKNESYYTHEYTVMYRSDLIDFNYKLYSDKIDSTEVYDNLFSIGREFNPGNHNLKAFWQFSVNSTREFTGLIADYSYKNDLLSAQSNAVIGEKSLWASGEVMADNIDIASYGVYTDFVNRDVRDMLSLSYENLQFDKINYGFQLRMKQCAEAEIKAGYSVEELSLKYVSTPDELDLRVESPFLSADVKKALKYRQFVLNSNIGIKYESEKLYTDSEISLSYLLKHNNRITGGIRYQYDDNTIFYKNSELYNSHYLNAFVRLDITKNFSATGEFRNITNETEIYTTDLMPVHFFVRLKWYFFN